MHSLNGLKRKRNARINIYKVYNARFDTCLWNSDTFPWKCVASGGSDHFRNK